MRKHLIYAFALLTGMTASAQNWEVGAVGGLGYSPLLTLKNSAAGASAGLASGGLFGVYAGEDTRKYFGGEVNYLYRISDFKLENSSVSAKFAGHTHLITGDLLFHFKPKGARLRPYVSAGGGIKVLQGTGQESAKQPLGNFAALTATKELLPVGEVGVGVKYRLTNRIRLRFQLRDYINNSPNEVIAPAPGARFEGIMHDLAATGGIGITW